MSKPCADRRRLSEFQGRARLLDGVLLAPPPRFPRRPARRRRRARRPVVLPAAGRLLSFALRADQDRSAVAALRTFPTSTSAASISRCLISAVAILLEPSRDNPQSTPRSPCSPTQRACNRPCSRPASARGHGAARPDPPNELPISVFTLDTGRLPAETYRLMQQVEEEYGGCVTVYFPMRRPCSGWSRRRASTASTARRPAQGLLRRAQERAARPRAGRQAGWVTGLRAAQSVTRTHLAARERDATYAVEKFNPLHDWSEATSGPTSAPATCPTTNCTTLLSEHRLRACTRAITPGETSARGAGGGSCRRTRSAAARRTAAGGPDRGSRRMSAVFAARAMRRTLCHSTGPRPGRCHEPAHAALDAPAAPAAKVPGRLPATSTPGRR